MTPPPPQASPWGLASMEKPIFREMAVLLIRFTRRRGRNFLNAAARICARPVDRSAPRPNSNSSPSFFLFFQSRARPKPVGERPGAHRAANPNNPFSLAFPKRAPSHCGAAAAAGEPSADCRIWTPRTGGRLPGRRRERGPAQRGGRTARGSQRRTMEELIK